MFEAASDSERLPDDSVENSLSQTVPPSVIDNARNLAYLWPHEPYALLLKRLIEGSRQAITVSILKKTGEVLLTGRLGKLTADLALLPPSFDTGMTIIVKKGNHYWRIWEILASTAIAEDLESRKVDLMDYWGRNVLYLDRLMELIAQWSKSPDRPERCRALELFLAQEYSSTNHATNNVHGFEIQSPDLDSIMAMSKWNISTYSLTN